MTGPTTPWLDERELHAWVELIKLSARLVTLSDGALRRDHAITGRDYELLHHLSEADTADGRRIGDLAQVIDDSSSGITHRVNRLAADGFVAKRPDPTDGRARRIHLTDAGRALLRAAAPSHVERVRHWVLDALDGDDLDELARLTGKLNANLRATAPLEAPADEAGPDR